VFKDDEIFIVQIKTLVVEVVVVVVVVMAVAEANAAFRFLESFVGSVMK